MSRKLCKQNISRLMALLLVLLLVVSNVPAVSAAGGSCGSGLTWSLSGGTLTISGSGAMENYGDGHMAPWYGSREQITRLSLPEGLTHIGSAAFYGCTGLTSASVPGSVKTIGELAFSNCSGMTMLTLNSGLQVISDNAFEMCASLQDLRIPSTVTKIGHHAFYFCTSLTYVSIPGSVTSFGSGIFSYCDALSQADIAVNPDRLPSWTFYGCDQLNVVNTSEGSISASELKIPNIPEEGYQESPAQPGTPTQPAQPTAPTQSVTPPQQEVVTQVPNGNTTVTTQTEVTPSGETTTNNTVVKTTENSTTVNTSTTTEADGNETTQQEITATVVTPEGWDDVIKQVENAQLNQNGTETEPITTTVFSPASDTVEKEVLQNLSGKNVSLTVQTQSGAQFTLDCTRLPEKVKKDLVLNYSLIPLENVPEGMEGCTVYQLTFEKSADFQVEMIIRLPGNHSYQTATLYRMDKKQLLQLQSVMVDAQSNAHWYLRSIDHKQEYLIGINIPGATTESPIIPAELAGIHKVANVYDGVEYVVTGRSSSWNMGLGRVMIILAAVMVTAIVVIGFVMFSLNKRRLKNGYMPDWSDEDEE